MLQTTSGQQVPTDYFIAPTQHHTIPPIHNYPSEDYTSQQLQRMTSTSEEEEETQNNSQKEWQVIRYTKRKKIHKTQHLWNKNRNTQPIWLVNKWRFHWRKSKFNEDPKTSSSIRTWCYKLRWNDKKNKRHSRRWTVLHKKSGKQCY